MSWQFHSSYKITWRILWTKSNFKGIKQVKTFVQTVQRYGGGDNFVPAGVGRGGPDCFSFKSALTS